MKRSISISQVAIMLRRNSEHSHLPEAQLWIGVIIQAMHDALHHRDPRIRAQAQRYFHTRRAQEACDHAGLDAEYVRGILSDLLETSVIRQQRGGRARHPVRLAA